MTVTKTRKGKSKVWIVLLVIVGVIVIGLSVVMIASEPGRREAMNVTIGNVDFKRLRDGVYIGQYTGVKDHLRDTKVEVTISSGEITDIKVIEGALANEKQTTEVRNGQTINDLFARVIQSDSLQVDVISGATISSKVHLKAIENALEQAEIDEGEAS
ncbi:FMN-binding protein [Oscillospiraceae bacterium WX1]